MCQIVRPLGVCISYNYLHLYSAFPKISDHQMSHLFSEWQSVNQDIQQLHKQQKNAESTLAFRFVEGTLVQAVQKGDWVLLDEINLATPETLECLCGLLESSSGSVVLMERG